MELLETGFTGLYWGHIVMWLIAFLFIYLGIAKKMEPLLLIPIGFGMLLVNLPLGGLFTYANEMPEGILAKIFRADFDEYMLLIAISACFKIVE